MTNRHIIDNRTHTVADHLKQALTNADAFSFVSAYFTVHGYALLAEQLESRRQHSFPFR